MKARLWDFVAIIRKRKEQARGEEQAPHHPSPHPMPFTLPLLKKEKDSNADYYHNFDGSCNIVGYILTLVSF